jgi:hypothetical protein
LAVTVERLTPDWGTLVAVVAVVAVVALPLMLKGYVPVADDGITDVTSAALGIDVKFVPVSVGAPYMADRVILDARTEPPREPADTEAAGTVPVMERG